MKRLFPTLAILFACASSAWAAAPAPLTTLHAIHALTNAEASIGQPVAFVATVTYYRGKENTLFVQDGDAAIYVFFPTDLKLVPGDRVLIRGKTQGSFNPIISANSIVLLRHGVLLKPVPASFEQMIRAETDCKLVTVRAVVRAADITVSPKSHMRFTHVQLLMDGGYIDAYVDSGDASILKGLMDAEVELNGVASEIFDSKMQQTGILLHVSSLQDVKILKRAGASPWSLPITPMDRILAVYHVRDSTQRVRIHGTITYYQPGSGVVLQDGAKSLWIDTSTLSPLQIGDISDATGFPDTHNGSLILTHGEIEDSHVQVSMTPQPATWQQLASWSSHRTDGHLYDLVSIEGQVVTEVRGAVQDEYVLVSDGQLFSAIYRHPGVASNIQLSPMKQIPPGSRARVIGICMNENTHTLNYSHELPFNILMRSFDDIAVVARPSLVNTRNLLLALGLLLVVVFAALTRGWALERKVRCQTAVMSARTEAEAELERQRSRILEDINGVRPLAEILEGIAAMVSATLEGTPCWREPADGARQGAYPQEPHTLRIVQAEIPSRSGPPLGTIYAALHTQAPLATREAEALHSGARLATLAIETRRLYSDLRRRSEFDLLTDIPNRFAMEKFMELQIEEASHSGRVLGLIYIDLDKFKPINDTYGHHVGDLYLQAVALRMSRQLLGGDMLARLGGDEFAAMVLLHHGRSDLEKIVARLESCFDEPYTVEGIILYGEASIGVALFPEDGVTKDNLLSAADAAMYAVKNAKRQAA